MKKVTSSDNGDVEDGDNNPGGGNTPSGGNPSGGSEGGGDTTITTKPDGSGSEEGSNGKLEA